MRTKSDKTKTKGEIYPVVILLHQTIQLDQVKNEDWVSYEI